MTRRAAVTRRTAVGAGLVGLMALAACASTADGARRKELTWEADSMIGGRVGHWETLLDDGEHVLSATGAPPYLDNLLARGEHLEARFIVARGAVPPPTEARDEVLIVLEGRAVVAVDGKPRKVASGRLAVLPGGARGAIEPRDGTTFCALVVRAREQGPRPAGAAPWVQDLGKLDPILKPAAPPWSVTPAASIPGRIGLYTYRVMDQKNPFIPGTVPAQLHAKHDEVLLVLTGDGNLGLGSAGHVAQAGTIALIPANLAYTYSNISPHGTRGLLVAVPDVAGHDPTKGADLEWDITPPTEPERKLKAFAVPAGGG